MTFNVFSSAYSTSSSFFQNNLLHLGHLRTSIDIEITLSNLRAIFSGHSVIYLATICQRMIRYSDSHDFDPQQILALFDQTDWARGRSLNDIQRMLAETDVTISAWDGSQLVGCCRVLTDYVYRASIWDVIVDVQYHDQDIGKGLIRRILTHASLDQVELFWLCTRRYQGFYASLGFSDKEQTGMVWDRRKQPPLSLP